MSIQAINAKQSIYKLSNSTSNLIAKKPITTPETLNNDGTNATKAFMNYFLAAQAIRPNFTGHSCPTKDFQVKRLEEVPCACCGKDMLTTKSVNEFVNQVSEATGDNLINVLQTNINIFRPTERAIAVYMIETAKDDDTADIQMLLKRNAPNAEEVYRSGQKSVLNKINEKAVELLGEDNVITPLIKASTEKADKNFLKRREFLRELKEVSTQINDVEKAGKLMDEAISLPLKEKDIVNFLEKYSKEDSFKIAQRLAQRAEMTAEHIRPRAQGGRNNTANYMGECAQCNNSRGTTSLETWMEEYPNMPRSSQRYIDEVTERIAKGDVGKKYDDYPVDLEKTLQKETKGIIKLQVKTPEEIDKIREEKGYKEPKPEEKKK